MLHTSWATSLEREMLDIAFLLAQNTATQTQSFTNVRTKRIHVNHHRTQQQHQTPNEYTQQRVRTQHHNTGIWVWSLCIL